MAAYDPLLPHASTPQSSTSNAAAAIPNVRMDSSTQKKTPAKMTENGTTQVTTPKVSTAWAYSTKNITNTSDQSRRKFVVRERIESTPYTSSSDSSATDSSTSIQCCSRKAVDLIWVNSWFLGAAVCFRYFSTLLVDLGAPGVLLRIGLRNLSCRCFSLEIYHL